MASEHFAGSSSSSVAAVAPALAAGAVEGPKPPASKGRGKRLTDSQRMEIIARLEDKTAPLSRAKVARMYGVTPAAISKLMKVSQHVKKRYTDAGADAGNARDKRQRGGFVKNVCFEDELYQWICSVRARNIPLLVAHVQQKAKLLAHRHKMGDGFKASNGWYYRFCSRYGLTPASLHAGSGRGSHSDMATPTSASPSATRARSTPVASAATASAESANTDIKLFPKTSDAEFAGSVTALQAQIANYGPEFVYSLSEARLFYQLLPSYVRPPPTPAELSTSATGGATAGTANTSSSGPSRNGSVSASPSSGQPSESVGKMERVLLLVCTNGTGTHKIPLLVVGKDPAPPSLQALKLLHLTNGSSSNGGSSGSTKALDLSTQYYSQREVWCDRHTFSYWCEHIFLPAIRQRTARPVLLLVENPGGHLDKFEQENVLTAFVPTRSQAGGAVNSGGDNSSSSHASNALSNHPVVRMQPMQCGIIRDLKRRYKIALFHAMLTFLERPDDERFRLHQRAAKKPPGCAGISFGCPPHLHDAIRVLDGAWKAIPSDMMRECWVKSELTPPPEVSKLPAPSFKLEVSDELVVLELCSMLRNVTVVDDMNALAKELRQWLNSDDDNSERMQQELLHDIQQLLQEEEHIQGKLAYTSAQQQQHEQSRQVEPHHQQQNVAQDMMSLNMSAAQRLVAAGIDPAAAAAAMGFDPQFLYRTDMSSQSRQAQHVNPAVPPGMDVGMLIREKQKAVAYALRSLAAAEEALDSPFVTEFFGEPTAAAAMETVSHVLRELRRVQRGRQSTLVAAPGSSAGPTLDEDAAATTSAHEYFYGPGP
jgi:hypothetical protein